LDDWPVPAELKKFHFECLQGMYFDVRRRLGEGDLLLSSYVRDPYYNYLAVGPETTEVDIDGAEQELLAYDRAAAAYLGPDVDIPDGLVDIFKGRGYSLYGTDAWMGLELPARLDIALPATVTLEYVDERGVTAYVDAFRAAYSGSTEDDPYGNLDDGYTKALERSFMSVPPEGFSRLFLQAVEGNEVVGVGTLFIRGETAGCYGVGVVPSHRRRGIGQSLMDRLAITAEEAGVRWLFLQTESGSAVEGLYKSFNYRSLFDARYVVREA
jgi:GNAT superfamily N-acetyltransferase